MSSDDQQLLRKAYEAFNARDIDAVVGLMSPQVDWPKAWEGGRIAGHDAVREYWTRQFAEIDSTVEPTGFKQLEDGRIAVIVAQTVRDPGGVVISQQQVTHIYEIGDSLIVRMDVEEP